MSQTKVQWLGKQHLGMLFGVMLALWPSFALACTPPVGGHPEYTVTEHTNAAAIVLEGTVVGGHSDDGSRDLTTATIEVTQYFKGVAAGVGAPFVYIEKFGSTARCRSQVSMGDHLIFYVKIGPNGQWQANYMGASDATAPATPQVITEIIAAVGSQPVAPLPSTPGPVDPTSIPITGPNDPSPTIPVLTPELPRELPATSQTNLPLIWWILLGLCCLISGSWLRQQYLKSRL